MGYARHSDRVQDTFNPSTQDEHMVAATDLENAFTTYILRSLVDIAFHPFFAVGQR